MAAEIKWIKVLTDIFEDEKIKLIKSMPEGRTIVLLWFQLLMQAGKTNAGGWVFLNEETPYTSQMLSVLFSESQQMIELAIRTFANKSFEMIEIDSEGRIYIPNWEKHQAVDKLDKIREDTKKRVADHRNKKKLHYIEGNVTGNADVTQSNATEIELELELEKDLLNTSSRNKKPTYSKDDIYYQMAEYFHEKIMAHAELNRKSHLVGNADFKKWSNDFRLLIEMDKRDKTELKKIIDWCTADPFWQLNILSPAKLRKQYVRLALEMDKKKPITNQNRSEKSKDFLKNKMQEVRSRDGGRSPEDTSQDFDKLPEHAGD